MRAYRNAFWFVLGVVSILLVGFVVNDPGLLGGVKSFAQSFWGWSGDSYIVLRDDNNNYLWVFRPDGLPVTYTQVAELPTETPSVTPSEATEWPETATFTPTSTNTPVPSRTPSKTPFSTFTPTVGVPTPTVEQTTATPFPSATPLKQCAVKLRDKNINLREGPSTGFRVLTVIPSRVIVTLTAANEGVGDPFLWGQTTYTNAWGTFTGWFAIRFENDPVDPWWVDGVPGTPLCSDIPGWPPGLDPPPQFVYEPTLTPTPYVPPSTGHTVFAFHTVPGGSSYYATAAQNVVQSHGVEYGIKSVNNVEECNAVAANGGDCIYRDLRFGDCPMLTGDPVQTAREWMARLAPVYVGVNAKYFEIVNECDMNNGAWWNSFILTAVQEANARGWKIVIPTLNPGVGDVEFWRPMIPALRAMAAGGHLVGLHDYSVYSPPLCNGSPYTAYRHEMTYQAICGTFGICNLKYAITEVGQGWGNEVPDVNDMVCWWDRVKNTNNVAFIAVWTLHGHSTCCWPNADWDNYAVPLAQRIFY